MRKDRNNEMMKSARIALTIALIGAGGWLTTGCETAPITGHSQFIIMSGAQATQMGVQAYQQILSKSKLSTNQDYIRRVQTIGRRGIVTLTGGARENPSRLVIKPPRPQLSKR
jgi:predicted Zn-dependent protease